MEDMTIEVAAARWGVSPRQVRAYCAGNRIPGATFLRGEWRIPALATKPSRKRRRTFSGRQWPRGEVDSSEGMSEVRHDAVCHHGGHEALLLSWSSGMARRTAYATYGDVSCRTGCVDLLSPSLWTYEAGGESRSGTEDVGNVVVAS